MPIPANRIKPAASALACLAMFGCSGPPRHEASYQQTAHHVRLAAANLEDETDPTLPAEEQISGPHDVDYYVMIALERNPQILAAARRVTAQAHVIPQATALSDPMLSNTLWPINDNSPQTASGRMPNTVMLSQQFPWLSKLRVRGEIAEQKTKIALTDLAAAQLKVIEDVKIAWYELQYLQRAIAISEASEELLRQVIRAAESRVRAGASQQDVLRALLERDKLLDRLIILRRQKAVAQADLASLLHTSPDARPEATEEFTMLPVPQQLDRLYDAAVRCRPELEKQLHALIRDQRAVELARLSYYPDVNVGVNWQTITPHDALSRVANGRDNLGLTVGVNLPIWQDKLRSGVREAENNVLASARQYDATRDDTFRLIRRLIVQARALQQQIELFSRRPDGIIDRARRTLEISLSDYVGERVDFQQVIENWIDLLNYRIQLARLQASLGQTLASLERVVGCQLAALPDAEPAAAIPGAVPPAPEEDGSTRKEPKKSQPPTEPPDSEESNP